MEEDDTTFLVRTQNTREQLQRVDVTGQIVVAGIESGILDAERVPSFIASVYAAITSLGTPTAPEAPPLVPAVPIKKSITPDAIICLEDGKAFKSLKRHLRTRYNLTPDEYRARWGLPADYPMAAPNYSAVRSALAKSHGLGTKGTH